MRVHGLEFLHGRMTAAALRKRQRVNLDALRNRLQHKEVQV